MPATNHVRRPQHSAAAWRSSELESSAEWLGQLSPAERAELTTALLDPGIEIPILIDRTTGAATEIVADALRAELEPRFDESARRRPACTTDL